MKYGCRTSTSSTFLYWYFYLDEQYGCFYEHCSDDNFHIFIIFIFSKDATKWQNVHIEQKFSENWSLWNAVSNLRPGRYTIILYFYLFMCFIHCLELSSFKFSTILNKDACIYTPAVYIFSRVYDFSLQLQWLNKYYDTIRRLMGPELDRQGLHEERDWMLKNTEPFMKSGSSASVCSSTLTLIALAIALLHNII